MRTETEVSKVKGLEIFFSSDDMNIIDSYVITNREKMKEILNIALEKTDIYTTNRSIESLVKEWVSHNRLYKMHLFRKSTKDCNFESELSPLLKIIYNILGI